MIPPRKQAEAALAAATSVHLDALLERDKMRQRHVEEQAAAHATISAGTKQKLDVMRVVDNQPREGIEPYPQGDERKAIHTAIDKLVATLASTGVLRKALQGAMIRLGVRPSAFRDDRGVA